MNALLALVPRRPRLSRLVKTIRARLTDRATSGLARASYSDALWHTYMRLADLNPDCSEAPDFYPQAAAYVQAAVLESARKKDPVSAEQLIEVIVLAVASPCLLSVQELGRIRARLTVAVAECRADAGRTSMRVAAVPAVGALAPR